MRVIGLGLGPSHQHDDGRGLCGPRHARRFGGGAFNGNRHVRAVLIARDGRRVAESAATGASRSAHAWVQTLLDTAPAPITLATPNRVRGFEAIALVLLSSTLRGLGLVYVVIGAARRPLDTLSRGFITAKLGVTKTADLLRLALKAGVS